MIERKDVAKEVSTLMIDILARLDTSILLVQKKCTDEEFKTYRKTVAQIMASMLDVVNPLYLQHPDLKPKGMD